MFCWCALPVAAQTGAPSNGLINPATNASNNALINNADVSQLCGRLAELMEAEGVVIPGLDRAAAPVTEAVRQNCVQLQLQPARASHTYALLANLRAYLALVDALPKPFPFPEAGERQLAELRSDATRLDSHFRALAASLDDRLVSPDPANLARYADANRRIAARRPLNRGWCFSAIPSPIFGTSMNISPIRISSIAVLPAKPPGKCCNVSCRTWSRCARKRF